MREIPRDILIEVMEDVIEDLHGHVHRVSDLAVDLEVTETAAGLLAPVVGVSHHAQRGQHATQHIRWLDRSRLDDGLAAIAGRHR